jgi:hypothetical protein
MRQGNREIVVQAADNGDHELRVDYLRFSPPRNKAHQADKKNLGDLGVLLVQQKNPR